MRRADAPFPAFRLWWRGASNGPRSRAVAAGTATVAFLAWIAVPSGGGVLANFATGLPVSSTTPSGQGAAPSSAQSAQLASNATGLATPSALLSPEATGAGVDSGGLGTASGDSAGASGASADDSGSVAPDTGGAPGTPGGPTTPSQSCPVPFPATNTPLESVTAQLSGLCAQVLVGGSGTVPAGALPGGGSGAGASGTSPVPRGWMYIDASLAASGGTNRTWSPGLGVEMAGKAPTVAVGLVQGATLSPVLAGALGDLVHHGALVQLLLVPEPTAAGGAGAFGSWVSQVLGALPSIALAEIGTGAAPKSTSAPTVAADASAGLAAAHDAPSHPAAGVAWLDDGTAYADAPVWSALDSAGVWSKSSFVARWLDAAGVCASSATFATTLRRYPAAAALPVVSETVHAPAPAGRLAADSTCVKASVAQDPAASAASWRLWEGPVPR